MDKFIYFAAYVFAIVQIIATLFMAGEAYGSDQLLALLFLFPPIFAIWALSNGYDREERQLMRTLHKAKLKHEIESLTKK